MNNMATGINKGIVGVTKGFGRIASPQGRVIDITEFVALTLADESVVIIFDYGTQCCESRYMRTDDVLEDVIGSTLLGVEVRDACLPVCLSACLPVCRRGRPTRQADEAGRRGRPTRQACQAGPNRRSAVPTHRH